MLQSGDGETKLGLKVLQVFDVFPDESWYWKGAGALFGIVILLNVIFTLALMYLNRKHSQSISLTENRNFLIVQSQLIIMINVTALGKPQAIISEEKAKDMEAERDGYPDEHVTNFASSDGLTARDGNNTSKSTRLELHLCYY